MKTERNGANEKIKSCKLEGGIVLLVVVNCDVERVPICNPEGIEKGPGMVVECERVLICDL
jgi:hypothetical protein